MIKTKSNIESFGDYIQKLYKYNYPKGECLNITFQITEDCNLNCSYCYQHHKTKNKMSFETAKQAIDDLLQNKEKFNKYFNLDDKIGIIIEFIGGEPLLEIDLIDQIMEYFTYQMIKLNHPWLLRHRISICTNGILYFSPKVQNFIKKYKQRLSLGITLDGSKELHDMCRKDFNNNPSYDIVEKAIKYHKENYDNNLSSKLTISPNNINFLFDGIKNFIDLGFKDIFFNPVFEEGWTEKEAKIYYEQLKKTSDFILNNNLEEEIFLSQLSDLNAGYPSNSNNNWCGGTGKMLAIDCNGDFYPCLRYTPSSIGDKQEKFIIGNIKNGMGSTKESNNRIKLLKTITRDSQSEKKCLNCPISGGCSWCSAYNYEKFGTPNKRATFICQMHQARVLAMKYYYKKYNLKEQKEKINYELNIPEEWALKIINREEYDFLIRE